MSSRNHINKSLDRALRILELFDENHATLTASQIAASLNTTPATIYPTLHTLTRHGYLSRDKQKLYRLGMKLLERSGQVLAQSDLRRTARPHLRKLAREHQVTVDLAILYGSAVLYLEREFGHPTALLTEVVGRRVPLHCTSLGKVLLAYLPGDIREEFVRGLALDRYTPRTITGHERLLAELETIRKQGYALDIEEFHRGSACVGAPLWSHGGRVVAAISMMLPVDERVLSRQCEREAEAVTATAQHVSRELGYAPQRDEDAGSRATARPRAQGRKR